MDKEIEVLAEKVRSVSSAVFMSMFFPKKANEIEFYSVFPEEEYEDIARK
jgi:hypothetical protein